jgi:uncharacterized protein
VVLNMKTWLPMILEWPTVRSRSYFYAGIWLVCVVCKVSGQTGVEAFDGSFRLATGEVITGGYFVEGGVGRYLFMDTEQLERGGLFERIDDTLFRSVVPEGAIEIEFIPDPDGRFSALLWREQGRAPVRGERVYPHRSREVRFSSSDGTELQGRLLIPECAGPHPVVVSVHGSGPVNRYGGPYHTDFLRHGVAVLAYDKRGYTSDPNAWQEPDYAALSADAAAAVRFAATQADLDQERIGIVGSSQAGWVIPRAAVDAPHTAFIILRAGAAASAAETVLHERRQELRLQGLSGLDLDHAMELRALIYGAAMRGAPISATDPVVDPYLDKTWYRAAFGDGRISERWSARWWQWAQRNLGVAGTTHLQQFDGPVLWFLAELDENVPLVTSRAALERAFEASPGTDHEIVVLDGALHSFLIPDADGPPRFSPGFFDHMGTWMADRGFSRPGCWAGVTP